MPSRRPPPRPLPKRPLPKKTPAQLAALRTPRVELAQIASGSETDPLLARIETLTRKGATAFIFLLSFLVFAVITLVAVEDADFFIPSRQTALPLLDVLIPTAASGGGFYIAPILLIALFANLHLQLLKLWEALGAAPDEIDGAALHQRLFPWLVTDLALWFRNGGRPKDRPLAILAAFVTGLLTFVATPAVLGWFWWRSMPKHDPLLTLGILGTAFWISLVFSTASFGHMRRKLRRRERRLFGHIVYKSTGTFAALAIFAVTWTSTIDSVLDTYFRFVVVRGEAYKDLDLEALADKQLEWGRAFEKANENSLWLQRPSILASANLANVTFSQLPPDWLSWKVDQQEDWPDWCADHGVPREVCDQINPSPWSGEIERPAGGTLDHLSPWCKTGRGHAPGLTQTACDEMIQALRKSYAEDWAAARVRIIRASSASDLAGKDLRNAILRDAQLQGANLRNAKLQGAELGWAKLQGANLWEAQLQEADLRGAQWQGANLRRAQLQGANLTFAQLQGAELVSAKLQGADLRHAQLREADLGDAQLQGANLWWAQLQEADLGHAQLQGADLGGAQFQGADLRGAQLQGANLQRAQLQRADLGGAQLQRADLTLAELQGVNLRRAQLQGADLELAKFDAATDLSRAALRGALLGSVDLSDVPQSEEHLDPTQVFFDGSITLPGGITSDMSEWPYEDRRETHEYDWDSSASLLDQAWRAWQRAHHPDTLPDHLR